jgi:glycosyltransferase
MKLSIITVSLNSAATIENTINSVLGQTYSDIEYIIIDGGSTDGTLGIVNKYRSRISKLVSKKDGGIYEAMNKGIELATGEMVGILNSDDVYASNETIKTVMNMFIESRVDCVWGDLVYVDKNDSNKIVRNWKSSAYQSGSFQKGWHPPHPTFFVRRSIYEKYGSFRTDLNTSADYELMLRFLERYRISSSYIPQVLVKMRNGGQGNRSYYNLIRANIGSYRAFKLNGLKVSPLFMIQKPLSKVGQFK